MKRNTGFSKHAEELVYRAVKDGMFEIDVEGRIWRLARQQTSSRGEPTKLVPCERRRGETHIVGKAKPGQPREANYYMHARVMYDRILYSAQAHRLVWYHFFGHIPGQLTVNHIDGQKNNNHPDNLELATQGEQRQHALKVLGWKPGQVMIAQNSKLNLKKVKVIRTSPKSSAQLAALFGVTSHTINHIRRHASWKHV